MLSINYSLLEKGILGNHPTYPSTGNLYSFTLVTPALISFVIGCLIGLFELLYLNQQFQKTSLLTKLIAKTAIYTAIIICALTVITTLSAAFDLG